MSVDQRPTHQWIVKVKNIDDVMVNSGESIEIGRKPLRPLPDEGKSRLDVPDETRSMSKRHAIFSVTDSGSATIRDLHSTNGTYIVRANGGLVRVPLDQDFLLPRNEMILQFGDVPVSFKRHDIEAKGTAQDAKPENVSDLFSYATDNAPVEPDAADMSVDDILDLRAGEPTSAFDASSVRSRLTQLHDAALGEASPGAVNTHQDDRNNQDDSSDNAKATAAEAIEAQAHGTVTHPTADGTAPAAESKPQTAASLQDQLQAAQEPASRDLFEDALSDALHIDTATAQDADEAHDSDTPQGDDAAEHAPDVVQETATSSTVFTPLASSVSADDNVEDVARNQPSLANEGNTSDAQHSFTPMFEPGSVFAKVSQGAFSKKQHVVEAGGFTSDDARTSHDFTKQFDMARHPELLPFLAMNTSLYDDLYAWLAAQGNQDIDAALQSNTGYQEYLEATRK